CVCVCVCVRESERVPGCLRDRAHQPTNVVLPAGSTDVRADGYHTFTAMCVCVFPLAYVSTHPCVTLLAYRYTQPHTHTHTATNAPPHLTHSHTHTHHTHTSTYHSLTHTHTHTYQTHTDARTT